jgi:hypothetical protein
MDWQELTRRDALALTALVSVRAEATSKPALQKKGADLQKQAKAAATVRRARGARSEVHMRKISFSGYDWAVKGFSAPVGPGPNFFSDSEQNVFVDKQGRLHLRIDRVEGRWRCAEVISERSFGLGTYRFTIDSGTDDLDPNVVLGLFTWSDAPQYHHRELDVEISRWGEAANANAQFVVQPYTHKDNIVRFSIPRGRGTTTHSITWAADRVVCQSWAGAGDTQPRESTRLYQHTFTQDIPQPGGENARINLWLLDGKPPADGKEVEIVCGRFAFNPPDSSAH